MNIHVTYKIIQIYNASHNLLMQLKKGSLKLEVYYLGLTSKYGM